MKRSPIVNPDEPKKNDVNSEPIGDVIKRLRGMAVEINASMENVRHAMLGATKPLTKSDVALTNPTTEETNEENTTAGAPARRIKEPQDHLPPLRPHAIRGKTRRRRH